MLTSIRLIRSDSVVGELGSDYTVSQENGLVKIVIYQGEGGQLYDEDTLTAEYDLVTGNGVTIVPVLEDGSLPDQALLDKVLAAVSAENVRPMTDVVTVAAPEQVSFNVNFEYYVTAANEAAAVAAIEGEGGAIDQYIAWQRGATGRDINPDKLRQLVLNAGADRVIMVAPIYTQISGGAIATFSGTEYVTHVVEG